MNIIVDYYDSVELHKNHIVVDGDIKYRIKPGAWTVYVPGIAGKIFHSISGFVHCTHKTAPDRKLLIESLTGIKNDRYTVYEWQDIYTKSVFYVQQKTMLLQSYCIELVSGQK